MLGSDSQVRWRLVQTFALRSINTNIHTVHNTRPNYYPTNDDVNKDPANCDATRDGEMSFSSPVDIWKHIALFYNMIPINTR